MDEETDLQKRAWQMNEQRNRQAEKGKDKEIKKKKY